LFRYDVEDTLSPLRVTFTDLSYYEPDTWHWDFGDGIQSQEKDPVHAYALPGSYTVCLRASNANASDTFCRQVVVNSSVGIKSLPALPLAPVAPNPFSDLLRVQLPALLRVSPRFVLYDLLGREVHAAWLRDFDNDLQLSQLPPGMYVWQLRWNGEVAQSGRVVKR
ncbi:MAG: PKD domain-containing protein, partial [Saprospiraceae bacterium]